MFRKFIKQNIILLSTVIVLIILFAISTYFITESIVENEEKSQDSATKNIITGVFTSLQLWGVYVTFVVD